MTLTIMLSVWGAAISTGLAWIKIWETFWKDRTRLDTTYTFTGERGGEHEIVIANLSSLPVQVSSWELAWDPRFLRFDRPKIDVTPAWEDVIRFKIDGHSTYTLKFAEENKFPWGHNISRGRQLKLKLKIFGRRRWQVLQIT
ncbi:hypothetical protein [Rhizobium sp. ZW T2_16]|uniref:hypothetical protein n=1 Tax=Rhizobium sp. ZW T2_16 TaxID=3378083 RepID=UPI000FBAF7C8